MIEPEETQTRPKHLEFYTNQNKAGQSMDGINRLYSDYKKWAVQKKMEKVNYLNFKQKFGHVNRPNLNCCKQERQGILSQLQVFCNKIEKQNPLGPMVSHPSIKIYPDEIAVFNKEPNFMVRS